MGSTAADVAGAASWVPQPIPSAPTTAPSALRYSNVPEPWAGRATAHTSWSVQPVGPVVHSASTIWPEPSSLRNRTESTSVGADPAATASPSNIHRSSEGWSPAQDVLRSDCSRHDGRLGPSAPSTVTVMHAEPSSNAPENWALQS